MYLTALGWPNRGQMAHNFLYKCCKLNDVVSNGTHQDRALLLGHLHISENIPKTN